jgi:hypothetical protein
VQLAGGEATPHFLKANPMPSLRDGEVAKAVCEHLLLN